jgi:hypothetical protein
VLQRAGEQGEVAGVAAQRADELAGGRVALQQAPGDAQQIVVVLLDEPAADLVARKAVQRPVVGRVDAPERRAAGVREPRRVLVAEQAKQAEDDVGVADARDGGFLPTSDDKNFPTPGARARFRRGSPSRSWFLTP